MIRAWLRAPVFRGLCLVALACGLALVLLTAPSRARLAAMRAEGERLATQEAALVARLGSPGATGVSNALWPEGVLWPGADRAAIELALQEALLGIAKSAGLRVVSFGPGAAPKGLSQAALGFEMELEGGHGALAAFLAETEKLRPRLASHSLWLRHRAGGAEVGEALVTARIGLWGFVAPEGE